MEALTSVSPPKRELYCCNNANKDYNFANGCVLQEASKERSFVNSNVLLT